MTGEVPPLRRDRPRLPAAERRHQIMEITSRLIAERGFWGMSMQDVADRCGLTVPGVLRHFGSKTGLLTAVLAHRDLEDARSLRAHLGVSEDQVPDEWSDAGPVGVDLRQLCSATIRRNARQPEFVRLFVVLEAESLTPSHPAHAYFVKRQQQAVAAFTALAKDHTDQPDVLAGHIVAMMDGLQIQWLHDPEGIDLVRRWEAAAEVLFGGPAPTARP
ncbi:TetR/AcrR family transcriptional regulator [Actinacidiphila acididurans]|uniref:TetR/AcrR family transcriptional regulator n=1 Tax=Actinacidiphila acididurans TaxID=2784346 RepID=A0ABS2TTR5_9ACTN|nr:TetR/AcrR family transcriptional regulator [Actinacidiphila acididurans]MBM9506212.1 TetR/AcrR family transcriptional regulator [Actinacidiphila acididurans]